MISFVLDRPLKGPTSIVSCEPRDVDDNSLVGEVEIAF